MKQRKLVIKNGTKLIVIKLLSTLLAFILSVILARSLGADGYGAYSFVLSLLMLLSIPVQAGLPNLAIRETSRALVSSNWSLIRKIWAWVVRLNISYFIFLAIILFAFSYLSEDWVNTERYKLFLGGVIMIPIMALSMGQSAIIRGLGRVVVGSIFDGLVRFSVILLLLGFTVVLLPDYELSPFYTINIYLFSIFIAYLASLIFLRRQIEGNDVSVDEGAVVDYAAWRKPLYTLTIIGGVQLVFGYADTFILGVIQSDQEVGIYRVVVQISSLVVFGLTALNQMLYPYFSRLYAEKNMSELQKLVSFSARVILLLAILPSVLFLSLGEPIITYIYGQEYSIGIGALSILVIGNLLNAAFGSVGAILNMTGHERDSMRGMIIALIVNIGLDLVLIPFYGMEGAATATAVSMVVWNFILWRYVKLRLNIESAGFLPAKMD